MKPEVLKSWSLEELRVLVLTKRHVGSGNEIGPNQGLSSLSQGGGKMRDPGNEVVDRFVLKIARTRFFSQCVTSALFLGHMLPGYVHENIDSPYVLSSESPIC